MIKSKSIRRSISGLVIGFSGLLITSPIHAKEIETNNVHMANAPDWLTRGRVEKVIAHIQMVLEWDIRKVEVTFYHDQSTFERAHKLGPLAAAFSRKSDNTIHLGPTITTQNFDRYFGHELVHIILGQKYKSAIPGWLEEGLANHLAHSGKVDYAWLKKQPFPSDVRTLTHPYGGTAASTHYHYLASQALIEMIAKKCNLGQLLQLSVGEKLEPYLGTYCEIKDLNADFRNWVKKH